MLTSRPIQLNADGAYFPTKTPGRGIKNRAENAYPGMGMAMTVNGKGKNANVGPRTPFQPASAQPQRLFKDQKTVLKTIGRPLIDKTPLPNRIGTVLFKTPLPGNRKLRYNGGNAGEEEGTPESAQRPSSMRKHIKHPRISGKALETPMNTGNHWDVSDGDIVLPDAQPVSQETIAEVDDDMDELEYGPPNTLELPYQPPFDFALPNYKEVGKTLFHLAHSTPYDDVSPPLEATISSSELEELKWDFISLPDLESDDPFYLARQTSSFSKYEKVPPAASSQPKRLPLNTTVASSLKQRPQSSLARIGAATVSRPVSRSTASTVNGVKRTASFATVRSVPASTAARATDVKSRVTARTVISRPIIASVSSTRSLSNAKLRTVSSTAKLPPASAAGKPRVANGLRRPHTSTAVNPPSTRTKANAVTTQTGLDRQKKPMAGSNAADVVMIKDVGNNFDDELDFRFDV